MPQRGKQLPDSPGAGPVTAYMEDSIVFYFAAKMSNIKFSASIDDIHLSLSELL